MKHEPNGELVLECIPKEIVCCSQVVMMLGVVLYPKVGDTQIIKVRGPRHPATMVLMESVLLLARSSPLRRTTRPRHGFMTLMQIRTGRLCAGSTSDFCHILWFCRFAPIPLSPGRALKCFSFIQIKYPFHISTYTKNIWTFLSGCPGWRSISSVKASIRRPRLELLEGTVMEGTSIDTPL